MTKPILVIKFGTASITQKTGELDENVLAEIARQVAELHQQYNIVLVSSGAVGAGKHFIKNYSGKISERKAAAAIGNPLLLGRYAHFFYPYKINIAQSLCERGHFANRKQFLQLKNTYEELWANNIIPVANENDVVSDLELKFSDNDELATLIAVGFGASLLLFSTSVPGVLDEAGAVIPQLDMTDKSVLSIASKEKSALGLGGMVSKLTFARLATQMGIKAIIFGIRTTNGILKAINGETGTLCLPQDCTISARKKWLASGSLVTGKLQIDAGAKKALQSGKSLLAVGILKVVAKFENAEVFEILDENLIVIAVARARVGSEEIKLHEKTEKVTVAHADEIVLL